ncbi:protein FRA10AC1 [Corythoichthys intestinalis]|uniref:protein FRA10AC1 n=1 Tax=Corythoichthys intestinalis TaxID=161448 RepID=UPI0025A58E44|nr:protein FRA10AC1 [Corythoichthys intestinalis]XP_061808070.1 protein FRA10AC1-like [Nerophis lumbriciformis]
MDNLVKVHGGGANYDSDFSDDETHGETSESKLKRKHEEEILQKPFQKDRHSQVAHRNFHANELDREEARNRRAHLISLNAFERHKKFVSDYILYYGGHMADFKRSTKNDKTDSDVLRENHRFLWRDEDEEDMTWEKELAKKYYDKLFKEYCIADLSRYKENKFGFRWRTETEVVSGKGQFQCGNKRCEKQEGLKSWEVNFAYVEQGDKRNALVKLRLCPECSFKLNFHHKRKEVKAKKILGKVREEKQESPRKKKKKSSPSRSKKRKHRRHRDPSSSSSSGSSDESSGKDTEGEACASESDHWRGPAPAVEEKSREEEFDDYFEDLFL